MKEAARHFQIERIVSLPRKELWELLSNTDRLNQVIQLPAVDYSPPRTDDPLLVRDARARLRGVIPLRWKEHPFHWVRGEQHAVLRIYDSGPLRRFWGGIRLADAGPEATRLTVFADLTPANAFCNALIPLFAKQSMEKTIAYCEEAVSLRRAGKAQVWPHNPIRAAIDEIVLEPLLVRLAQAPLNAELIPQLAELLRESDDQDVTNLRPKPLSRQWRVTLSEVLRLFLHATKLGLLNLSWRQMCPHCRVSKAEYSTLSQMPGQYDCDLCGLTYDTDFEKYVELRFAVHPQVRAASSAIYCIGGPSSTPHVLAQTSIESSGKATINVGLGGEKLRLRVLRANHILPVGANYAATGPVNYTDDGWEGEITVPDPDGSLNIFNRSGHDIVLALEKQEWDDSAVTAAQITAMREFRELFASEVLAPGQTVGIQSLTLMFSDLCDSTQLYESLGDAPAYGRVRRHFAWMFDIIGRNNGAIVKTIGDSVMAVFQSPEDALRGSIEIQSRVGEFNATLDEGEGICIKIGLHHGPAVAINANERLDYFGRTVNIAARLQNAGGGGDIVISDDFVQRAGVQTILQEKSLEPESFQANLKGIMGVFDLYRVRL